MAATKTASKGATKGKNVCANCDNEFTGSKCPECGNSVGNSRLAPDGIKQEYHGNDEVFGTVDQLEGYVRTTDDEFLMNVQNAKMAREEFTDNMRQSQVMTSEIKKLEKEQKLFQKRKELEMLKDGWEGGYPPPDQSPAAQAQMPEQPLFGTQSPQALFMSRFMGMNGETRAEFMQQLTDADPIALQTLSGMFAQPAVNQMMGQQMGMPGMYPMPWMQQPQQLPQQQEPKESTTTVMKEMFSLMKEMQPEKDNTTIEIIRDLKDEIKSLRSRVEAPARDQNGGGANNDTVIQYVKHLEEKIESAQKVLPFGEQVRQFKDTVKDLESIGVGNSGDPAIPIDEKIRMKELDHRIDMENSQRKIEMGVADTNLLKQQVYQDFAKQVFAKGFAGSQNPPDVEPEPVKQPTNVNPFFDIGSPKVLTKPKIVVDTIKSDAGTIREISTKPAESANPTE